MISPKLDSSGVAAVDPTYHWNRDMSACPQGVKVQLRTDYGIAIHGVISARTRGDFTGWTPLPTEAKDDDPAQAKIVGGHGSTRSTREYSGALYALADHFEQAGRLTADGAEMLREAAQRLDEQTIAIGVLRSQLLGIRMQIGEGGTLSNLSAVLAAEELVDAAATRAIGGQ